MITVYSRPSCYACAKVKNLLGDAGLDYEVIDLDEDDDARAYVIDVLKAASVPIIEAEGYPPIIGYKAREIADFIREYEEEEELDDDE